MQMMPGQVSTPEARLASTVREARAKVLWGEPRAEIREWMIDAGVDATYADQVIGAAMKERGAEVRAQGLKDLVVGILIFAVGAGLLVVVLMSGMISVVLVGGSGAGAAFGLFKMLRGLGRMIAGGRANVDVSDL